MGVCPRFFIEVGSSGKKIHCAVHNAYACLTNWTCAFTMQQKLTPAVNFFRQPVAKPWSCFLLKSEAPLTTFSIKAGSPRRRSWMFLLAALLLLGRALLTAEWQERP